MTHAEMSARGGRASKGTDAAKIRSLTANLCGCKKRYAALKLRYSLIKPNAKGALKRANAAKSKTARAR
jgi:hypothetical protein